ncbi:hypothetical protein MAPG_09514 [Magnaporthiopsis poae ATCC 64411]|uniref:Uncharacterized protein n=1 Tax=Magnaporthiopsis poae (strain ATCC 64411 / 73-15) TaxID=644358 RepID=A0A0C4EA55_MAGP6|nr:hypothetical protein MAPG_09514 [Magnaporthiopsis poae ATCC 64411]
MISVPDAQMFRPFWPFRRGVPVRSNGEVKMPQAVKVENLPTDQPIRQVIEDDAGVVDECERVGQLGRRSGVICSRPPSLRERGEMLFRGVLEADSALVDAVVARRVRVAAAFR